MPIRMAEMKKTDRIKYWAGCSRKALWITVWQFLKKLIYIAMIYDTAIPLLRNLLHR